MGWNKGVDNAECDGCGYKEFSVNPKIHPYWHDEKRYKAGGIIDEFLFCGACHNKYVEYCEKQDRDFILFAKELGGSNK